MLSYWFYPNPGGVGYSNWKILLLFALCLILFGSSFLLHLWRRRLDNPVTRRLSRGWGSVLRWAGGIGFLLALSRAEGVQFLSTRFLWVLWALWLLLYVASQVWKFRFRHYTIVPRDSRDDPREKYLPKPH